MRRGDCAYGRHSAQEKISLLRQISRQVNASRKDSAVAGLSMTFWPNPVYRTHTGEMRWYFHVALGELAAKRVHLQRYRGEWYDMAGRLQESKEEPLDIHLNPLQHVSYPDLWVTSALPSFRYRMLVLGQTDDGQEVSAEAELLCR
jgi:hypothetical protein